MSQSSKPLIPRLRCLATLLQQLNAQTACDAVNEAIESIESTEALRQSQSLPAGAVLERWGFPDHPREARTALIQRDDGYWTPWHIAQSALQADAREKGEAEYQFEVWQGDECLAMGSAATSHECGAESAHMAMMYGQDGPVTVRFYERYEITDALATQPAQASEKDNG